METNNWVLVTIVNKLTDWKIVQQEHWYRIPANQVEKRFKEDFPPLWLAFYQTKVFGQEAHMVTYYARVVNSHEVYRWQLFPDEPKSRKSNQKYCKLTIGELCSLPQPIISRRLRRIVFIPTTWEKFTQAIEINDLWNESPLEDRLWAEMKRLNIAAERQQHVKTQQSDYFLDFAVYCRDGKIDIETDGDTWHIEKQQAKLDNERDNALETMGWRTIRFTTAHVQEQMHDYCLPTIVDNINNLGGIKVTERSLPRRIEIDGHEQLQLFDHMPS